MVGDSVNNLQPCLFVSGFGLDQMYTGMAAKDISVLVQPWPVWARVRPDWL